MSNIAPLLDRNQTFARTDARLNVPALPFIPFLSLYIVTCIDCRVDPAQTLGVGMGEALVERNIGGRITPEVIRDIVNMPWAAGSVMPKTWARSFQPMLVWTGLKSRWARAAWSMTSWVAWCSTGGNSCPSFRSA